LIGHAVVARHRSKADREQEEDAVVSVDARLLGGRLKVITKQASRNVCRLTIQIPESVEERLAEEPETPRIIWDVMWGTDRAAKQSRIVLNHKPVLPTRSISFQIPFECVTSRQSLIVRHGRVVECFD
ncbi:MAG: hypothetical protein MI861_02270, partial [Pirellulales bacterium]|nr:hypothetical protein [Pirellulales bacterium]